MLAALDAFYQKGVARTSLNEIAQAAGVTRGALYWHFKNKEDLFDALFQHICDDIDNCMQEDLAASGNDHWLNFRGTLLKFFERLEHNAMHNKFYTILFFKCEHTEQNQAITSVVRKYHSLWQDKLATVLAESMKQGSVPEHTDTAFAIVFIKSNVDGLTKQWLSAPESFNLSQTAPRFIGIMLDSLQNHALMRKP